MAKPAGKPPTSSALSRRGACLMGASGQWADAVVAASGAAMTSAAGRLGADPPGVPGRTSPRSQAPGSLVPDQGKQTREAGSS